MRIAVDARELLGPRTGVGRYLAELLARWTRDPRRSGDEIVLLAPTALSPGIAAGLIGHGGSQARWHVVPGRGGTLWEQLPLARAVRALGPDVFFAPAYGAPLAIPCPIVVSMHDVSFFAHPEWFTWHEGVRRRIVAGMTGQRAARILTLAEAMRPDIVRHLRVPADAVDVIPPAVDAHPDLQATHQHASPEGHPTVLYVGSVFTRRNVPSLIRAFGAIASSVPQARLAIVGANRTHPPIDLRAYVAEAGITRQAALLDYVDDATLETLYASARAFVFLSAYEGFGLTPLEAMARGVPAIVLDTAVAREACGDGALYAAAPSAPEIPAWILALLSDDAFHAERAAAARDAASRWSWDATAERTWAVFDEVARRA